MFVLILYWFISLPEWMFDISAYDLSKDNVIMSGDFNCPHSSWGFTVGTRRGFDFADFLAEPGLSVMHDFSGLKTHYTTINGGATGNPDLTICSPGLASELVSWRVSDTSSSSNHRYVHFELFHEGGQKLVSDPILTLLLINLSMRSGGRLLL